jgi:hypothetical protein
MMTEIETQPQQLAPKRSSLTESEGEDAVTKGLLWKQGRGRSLSFLKPWRERLVVVDHKKMTLTYYQISDGSRILFPLSSLISPFSVSLDLIGCIPLPQKRQKGQSLWRKQSLKIFLTLADHIPLLS